MAIPKKSLLFIIALLPVFAGCKRKEDVVAYVGGNRITVSDFKQRMEALPDYYLGFIATEGGKKQYIDGMIKEEVLLLKGKELKIDDRPEVAQRLKNARREVLLASTLDYLQREKVNISDQDIRDYYEQHKEEFDNPMQIKVSHILLPDEKTAEKVKEKLDKGASFEKMARQYSIDTVTAINGGDLGYFSRGEMSQPEFEKEVFNMKKVGQISDIIKTSFGYHIAKLTGRRRGREKTFEEAKEDISRKLEKEKFNELLDEYRRQYNVRIDYNVLGEIKLTDDEEVDFEKNK